MHNFLSPEMIVALSMLITFLVAITFGIPICFAIGLATIIAAILMLPLDSALATIAQKMAVGLDNFALLAIPFFILAGTFMNKGGIAIRLINLASVLVGRVPGSLWHVNIASNAMFGCISGSAVASCAAVGKTMAPIQKENNYDPNYSVAVNVTSCISGLLIPPSNVLIVYALTAGGLSITTLFVAGYLPGFLIAGSVGLVAFIIAKKKKYAVNDKITLKMATHALLDAIPSLFLIVIIMGGILIGFFTPTEASAIAVVYTVILAVFIYKEVKIKEIPFIILESVITTSIVLLLIGISISMSWILTYADIPYLISDGLMNISDNPIVILLIINIILLIVGLFLDMTPAVLIFTPIFLPVVQDFGMDPVQFGILMVFNLCLGLCTPPVGSALFVGCSVGEAKIQNILKPMLPFYLVLFAALLLVTYVPQLSLFLPNLFGLK